MNHEVVNYAGTLSKTVNFDAQYRYIKLAQKNEYIVESTIKDLVEMAGNKKVILFNLDGVDLGKVKKFMDGANASVRGDFTNREIAYILENPKIFNHTRWFSNGKELTYDQLVQQFRPLRPELFN